MYSDRELNRLAAHKAALRRGIDLRRTQCTAAATQAAQPLEWVDRALTAWQKLPPVAKFALVPVGILVARTASRRLKILRTLLRWGPFVTVAARAISGALSSRTRSDRARSTASETAPRALQPAIPDGGH